MVQVGGQDYAQEELYCMVDCILCLQLDLKWSRLEDSTMHKKSYIA